MYKDDLIVLTKLADGLMIGYCREVYGESDVLFRTKKPVLNIGESNGILCIDFYDKYDITKYEEMPILDLVDDKDSRLSMQYLRGIILMFNKSGIYPDEIRVEYLRSGKLKLEIDEVGII